MAFEEEALSLFVLCCAGVILAELVIGCMLLWKQKRALPWFAGHVAAMSGALIVLTRMLFAKRLSLFIQPGMESETNSLMLAFFGMLWLLSVVFLLRTIFVSRKNPS